MTRRIDRGNGVQEWNGGNVGLEGKEGRVRVGARGSLEDVPLEFVGEIAGACTAAEAGHVKRSSATARHCCCGGRWCTRKSRMSELEI